MNDLALLALEIIVDCIHEVLYVNLDLYEHVKHLPSCFCYRHEAGVAVMYKQITAHVLTSNIVDAARTICDISQNHCLKLRFCKGSQYV